MQQYAISQGGQREQEAAVRMSKLRLPAGCRQHVYLCQQNTARY